jgi:hypothetical protein
MDTPLSNKKVKILDYFYNILLSEHTKERSEKLILVIAIISFLIHLLLIYLVDFGLLPIRSENLLLTNPIAAIYTPFSFILRNVKKIKA